MKAFIQEILTELPYQPDILLLAVSGGSDSVALLQAASLLHVDYPICVLHANHKLRASADDEARFVQTLAEQHGLECQVATWEAPAQRNIEQAARTFRYRFFAEVMQLYERPVLLTAHHQDDQVETLLRKLITGRPFHQGIPKLRPLANGYVARPFLTVTKQELRHYLVTQQIEYVEDESNQNLKFQRNRLRHQLIPQIQQENPQFVRDFLQVVADYNEQEQVVLNLGKQLFNQAQVAPNHWHLAKLQSVEQKYAFVKYFQKYFTTQFQKNLKQNQIEQIQQLLQTSAGEKELKLAENCYLMRSYQDLYLQSRQIVEKHTKDVYTLKCNSGFYLSPDEWIYFGRQKDILPPPAMSDCAKFSISCPQTSALEIRPPLAGDKIAIAADQHKKLARLFIDAKIPKHQRSQMRVVVDAKQRVIGVLPLRQAYLSKSDKTDKMYYITYYYRKN